MASDSVIRARIDPTVSGMLAAGGIVSDPRKAIISWATWLSDGTLLKNYVNAQEDNMATMFAAGNDGNTMYVFDVTVVDPVSGDLVTDVRVTAKSRDLVLMRARAGFTQDMGAGLAYGRYEALITQVGEFRLRPARPKTEGQKGRRVKAWLPAAGASEDRGVAP